jgi:hypothetical protein
MQRLVVTSAGWHCSGVPSRLGAHCESDRFNFLFQSQWKVLPPDQAREIVRVARNNLTDRSRFPKGMQPVMEEPRRTATTPAEAVAGGR